MSDHGSSLRDTQPDGGKTVADILAAAAEIVAKPGAWTTGDYARDRDGVGVDDATDVYEDAGAFEPVCFCAIGAINAARGERLDAWASGAAFESLREVIGGREIQDWNDAPERTQAEVVAALREAARVAAQSDTARLGTNGRVAAGSEPQ